MVREKWEIGQKRFLLKVSDCFAAGVWCILVLEFSNCDIDARQYSLALSSSLTGTLVGKYHAQLCPIMKLFVDKLPDIRRLHLEACS